MEAADLMTPTMSGSVKHKLQASAYENGFLMMTQSADIYALKGEAEFMRLTRKYHSLKFEEYDSMSDYLTKIKTLEERIRYTNVVLDDDKQTLFQASRLKHVIGFNIPNQESKTNSETRMLTTSTSTQLVPTTMRTDQEGRTKH